MASKTRVRVSTPKTVLDSNMLISLEWDSTSPRLSAVGTARFNGQDCTVQVESWGPVGFDLRIVFPVSEDEGSTE